MSCHTIRHVSADKGGTVLAQCRHGPLPSSAAINICFFCCYCCCGCLEACFGDWGEHKGLNPLVSQIATKEGCIQQPHTHNNAPHEGGKQVMGRSPGSGRRCIVGRRGHLVHVICEGYGISYIFEAQWLVRKYSQDVHLDDLSNPVGSVRPHSFPLEIWLYSHQWAF